MIGLGTIINTAAIIAGGIIGMLFGRFLTSKIQETVLKSTGLCVMFIGIGGVLEQMLSIEDGKLKTGGTMMMIGSLVLGALIGEIIDIDKRFVSFGEWLKKKTGNAKDKMFVDGFVTASLTVCIGAMAIVGALQDALMGDYSTLVVKSILDFIIVVVMSSSMGKGCMFSAIPVFLWQGLVTLGAKLIQPIMTEAALSNLSFVGSVLIFCIGLNQIKKDTVKTANLLPSVVIAVVWALVESVI